MAEKAAVRQSPITGRDGEDNPLSVVLRLLFTPVPAYADLMPV